MPSWEKNKYMLWAQRMSKIFFKTGRGIAGESVRAYSLSIQICIVSSTGTFVNNEQTSKEHIIPLLYHKNSWSSAIVA